LSLFLPAMSIHPHILELIVFPLLLSYCLYVEGWKITACGCCLICIIISCLLCPFLKAKINNTTENLFSVVSLRGRMRESEVPALKLPASSWYFFHQPCHSSENLGSLWEGILRPGVLLTHPISVLMHFHCGCQALDCSYHAPSTWMAQEYGSPTCGTTPLSPICWKLSEKDSRWGAHTCHLPQSCHFISSFQNQTAVKGPVLTCVAISLAQCRNSWRKSWLSHSSAVWPQATYSASPHFSAPINGKG
jgi:hypothetical protein